MPLSNSKEGLPFPQEAPNHFQEPKHFNLCFTRWSSNGIPRLSPKQRMPDSIFAYKRVGSNQWRATNKWTDPPLAGVPYSVTVGDRTTTTTPIWSSDPKNIESFQNSIVSSVYDCMILKLDSQWPRPDSKRNCDGFLLIIIHSEALYWAAVPLRVRH